MITNPQVGEVYWVYSFIYGVCQIKVGQVMATRYGFYVTGDSLDGSCWISCANDTLFKTQEEAKASKEKIK